MPPEYFPLRWESTGDQWWYASPIDWAAANGLYNIVRELLRLDTNLLIKLTSLRRIRRLETVWDDEAQFDDVARCRALVAHQLLHESEIKRGEQVHNSLFRAGYGGWFMYTAASAGDIDFVKELLERDPFMVFGEGEYGVTDILYAASRSKNSQVFRLLLDVAVSPSSCLSVRGEEETGKGPLCDNVDSVFKREIINRAVHAAARGGNVEILRELLQGCSDVLVYRDARGSSLMHTASGRGQVEVVKYLMESYDIITARDNQGNTALHVAAYRGYLNVVEVLILSCPSLASTANDHGDTFLHLAVAGFRTPGFRRVDRQIELVKQLVSRKIVDVGEEDIINIRNKDGRTALHVAVSENIQTNLVELLMTVPFINLNIRDANGMTPLDLLKQRPKSASSQILIKQLISAGGISNSRDVKARNALVSHLREGLSRSPGTSFRIPDAEIFLYAGLDNTRDYCFHDSSSVEHSRCLSELSDFNSGYLSENKASTSSPLNHIQKRLKFLFRWTSRKERKRAKSESGDDDSLESAYVSRSLEEYPIPLRQQYCSRGPLLSSSSLPNNKRTFSYQNSFPSPSTRKKFTARLMQGVIQPKSRFASADSCPSSRSGSSISSPVLVNKRKNLEGSVTLSSNSPSSNGKTFQGKQMSFNKILMNQYLCFGAQRLGMEDSGSSSREKQQYRQAAVMV